MRVATIDIGTNSVLLLIAERLTEKPWLQPVAEHSTITRLGQDVDRTRTLHPDAVSRTLDCLRNYAELIRRWEVDKVDVVATSAARDAQGAVEFTASARSILGIAPRVVSGEQEALLTFSGALSGLGLEGPVAVQDLGGGSTEIVFGQASAIPTAGRAVSVDMGCVRFTERYLHSDPPAPAEQDSLRCQARRALEQVPKDSSPEHWVGIGGTITTLAAMALGLKTYDSAAVHGLRMRRERVQRLASEIAGVALADRKRIVGLDPKRADVIVAGAVLVDELLGWAGLDEIVVSDRGVRWGLALNLALDFEPKTPQACS